MRPRNLVIVTELYLTGNNILERKCGRCISNICHASVITCPLAVYTVDYDTASVSCFERRFCENSVLMRRK